MQSTLYSYKQPPRYFQYKLHLLQFCQRNGSAHKSASNIGETDGRITGRRQGALDEAPTLSEDSKAYLKIGKNTYEFVCSREENFSPDTTEKYDVRALGIEFSAKTLTTNDVTELVNPIDDGIEYPDIAYDAISTSGNYSKEWVLSFLSQTGSTENVAGLKWKREPDSSIRGGSNSLSYRAYTLYFVGAAASGKTAIPVMRRYYRDAQTREEDVELNVEISFSEETGKTLVKISRISDEDDVDIRATVKINTQIGTVETIRTTIKAGESSSETEVECIGTGIQTYTAKKTVSYTLAAVTEEEVKAENSIFLSSLKTVNIRLSDYLPGETAKISFLNENYQKVATIYDDSTFLKCTDTDFDAYISVTGKLIVSKWGIEEDSSTANVEVEFYVDHGKNSLVTSCKYSTLYGVNGESDRLFVVNGDDQSKQNVIFFSEADDFSYFHSEFTKSVGGNSSGVQGFLRLANGSMAALKPLGSGEPTVFVFNGDYINGYYDAAETEPYTLPRFSTSGVNSMQGICSPYACSNLADDSLFLSQNGVYALELSQGK